MGPSISLLPLQPDEAVAGYLGRLALWLDLEWKPGDVRARLWKKVRELGHEDYSDVIEIVQLYARVPYHEIIESHSAAPFWHSFHDSLSSERSKPLTWHSERYISRKTLGLFGTPKVCPRCVQADLQEMGFSYWRRSHQTPGIRYCPRHDTRLKNIAARYAYYRQPHHFSYIPPQEDGEHKEARMFQDRMMQIWRCILKGRESLDLYQVIGRAAKFGRFREFMPWFMLPSDPDCKYSDELSQFLDEVMTTPDVELFRDQIFVATIAASNIEIEHLISCVTSTSQLRQGSELTTYAQT